MNIGKPVKVREVPIKMPDWPTRKERPIPVPDWPKPAEVPAQ